MQEGSRKAIIAAFFANLGIAIAKFAGFIITGSAGLLAEAGHSLADTGNQGLLMYGGKAGKRPADRAHPFGYGPERYFWSFVVALVLFSMGGLFALYEGYHKFKDPHEIESAGVAYAILGFAIVLESFSLRTAVKEANHVRGNRGWWEFVRTAKSPELPVVLLEDVGAEIGLVLALGGLVLAAGGRAQLAVLPLLLAVLTKQTYLVAPIAVCAALYPDRRAAVRFAVLFTVGLVGAVAAAQLLSGGWFLWHTVAA
ncbi:MAG TPA: cation diffusion facilitator family transporter, partial [Ilumatobacteraceae bacterium]|nr:cation diffusion facilitator family transporter [Ilumatobacteraceae bacterium]